jgi:competence protein ComEA
MKKAALLFAALFAYAGMALAVVNINSASEKQLAELDGIGPVKAKAIVDYRKKNGPFKSTEDIKKVDGVGDATYGKIKGDLVLSGTTTGPGKAAEKSDATKAKEKAAKTGDKVEAKAKSAKEDVKSDAKKAKADVKSDASKAKAEVKSDATKAKDKAAATEDKAEAKAKSATTDAKK